MVFKRIKSQESKRNPYWFENPKGDMISYVNVSTNPNKPEYEIRATIKGERKRIQFPLGSTKKISPKKVLQIAANKSFFKKKKKFFK